MPGGKGNIRPEDGKQFSSTYQPNEKWTEKKALELGHEMLDWFQEKDDKGNDIGNILFDDFLVIKKKLYPDLPTYLAKKFTSFLELYNTAVKIQEIKLMKGGLLNTVNVNMSKFILMCNHGMNENQNQDNKPQEIVLKFDEGNESDNS